MFVQNSSVINTNRLNAFIDNGRFPLWTDLKNLNSRLMMPMGPGEEIQTNGFLKRYQKTHYVKNVVSEFNNSCSNIINTDSPPAMKYPRIFRPVILQHHPEHTNQALSSNSGSSQIPIRDRELPVSNAIRNSATPNFLRDSGSSQATNWEDETQSQNRVYQFQLSVSESAKENGGFACSSGAGASSKYPMFNTLDKKLTQMHRPTKPIKLDYSCAPLTDKHTAHRHDGWATFQDNQLRMHESEVGSYLSNAQIRPYPNPEPRIELAQNWLRHMQRTVTPFPCNDRIQPYYSEQTNWTDSYSFNPTVDPYSFSNRPTYWNPLENPTNPLSTVYNVFERTSEPSSAFNYGSSHVPCYSPLEKKTISKKPNNCPYCNRSNSTPAQLKIHLRIHTGERPFVCDNIGCDKTFTRNEELTRHLRIHSGDRPYICKICQRGFGRKDHLTKHEVTHRSTSDKKVHICLISGCSQRYTRSDALARHRWNVHFIRPQIRNFSVKKKQPIKKQEKK